MQRIVFHVFPLIAILLCSCEKVVKLDLKNASTGVVVQGNITSEPGPYDIYLNNTVNYYDSNTFPAITGAGVILSDNAGNSETLTEISPGRYQTSAITGTSGRTYNLKITASGKEYTSSSTMPYPVAIDSVGFIKGRNNSYRLTCYFTDPGGVSNFYMLHLASRDTAAVNNKTVRVATDKLTDGQAMSITYRSGLRLSDTVTVDLESVDKATFDFYNTLQNAQGEVNPFLSAPPANPINNISNGGLGYFSAHSIATRTFVVK